MEAKLIAPCGMNCGVCMAYLREKDHCPGCRYLSGNIPVSISRCAVRDCETITADPSGFCGECGTFPCRRVKQLDKRYTAKYHLSMLENLRIIREQGVDALLAREAEKWRCPACGGTVSCHRLICATCGAEKAFPGA
jgi:hypothetical protein